MAEFVKRDIEWRDYAAKARRTSPVDRAKHERVKNAVLGLMGETGEIADIVKKFAYQSGDEYPLPEDELLKECGDVLWYTAEFADCIGIGMYKFFYAPEYTHNVMDKPYAKHVREQGVHSGNRFLVNSLYREAVRLCHAVNSFHAVALPIELSIGAPDTDTQKNLLSVMREAMAALTSILILSDRTLKEARDHNIEKLMKRYPEGFDPERSLHREEYRDK